VATSNSQLADTNSRTRWRVIPQGTTLSDNITGWLFILPAVFLIFIFGVFPIGYAIYMSLHRWRIRRGDFLGLENYTRVIGDWQGAGLFVLGFIVLYGAYWAWNNALRRYENKQQYVRWLVSLLVLGVGLNLISVGWTLMMSVGGEKFLVGLTITFWFAFSSIPIQIALALGLAYVLYQNIRGKNYLRLIFFLPYVAPDIAMAVVFRVIFGPDRSSLANQLVGLFGMEPQRWVSEPQPFINAMLGTNLDGFIAGPSMALISVVLLGIWKYVGYNAVIFMAGLGAVPKDLYEAARVDGANEWHLFRYITIPMISPVTFYLAILGFIGTFQAFNTIYAMRTPFAQGSMDVASIVIFDTFYKSSQYGLATAQAIVLFAVILVMTGVFRDIFGKRVFYG
jgi:ABC-type sugar transport system permease subunit